MRSATSAHGTEPSADLGKTMSASCAFVTCLVEPPPQAAAITSNPSAHVASRRLTGRHTASAVAGVMHVLSLEPAVAILPDRTKSARPCSGYQRGSSGAENAVGEDVEVVERGRDGRSGEGCGGRDVEDSERERHVVGGADAADERNPAAAGEVVGGKDVSHPGETQRAARLAGRQRRPSGGKVGAVGLALGKLPADAIDVERSAADHQADPDAVLWRPGDEVEVDPGVEVAVSEAARLTADIQVGLGAGPD